ncbi:hypothetical protein [Actinokineospora sp. NBRC 105648]|uniref:hypothetical protein n=1 Tax=Actinokineospora sp. NBRC 105648 TaxID=3032206 RepID=UPI0024A445DE|nr:hypothetical protein [Actinokineospora sp. NBRC 105648]GLZ39545.1 hypothetical protein Acsp05_31690 [Actinokineospora sp. NBRC 105648]
MNRPVVYRHPVERVALLWTSSATLLATVLGAVVWTPESGSDKIAFLLAAVVVAVATGYQALFPYCFIRDGKVGIRTVRGLRSVPLDDVAGVEWRDARAPLGQAVYRYPAITVGGRVVRLDRAHFRPGSRRARLVEGFLDQLDPARQLGDESARPLLPSTPPSGG